MRLGRAAPEWFGTFDAERPPGHAAAEQRNGIIAAPGICNRIPQKSLLEARHVISSYRNAVGEITKFSRHKQNFILLK